MAKSSKERDAVVSAGKGNTTKIVEKFRATADDLLRSEVTNYKSFRQANGDVDATWVERTTKSGTLSDRIASMSLLISESPVHRLDMLGELVELAGKEKRIAVMAGDALKDLFCKVRRQKKLSHHKSMRAAKCI